MAKKPSKKRAPELLIEPESDEHFAYIAGYTSGGAPYGITWEEQEEFEHRAAAKIPPPHRNRIEKYWYAYKDEAYKKIAREWCEDHCVTWRE